MISNVIPALVPQLILALAQSQPLTADQKASLKAELGGAAYQGKSAGEIVRLLNTPQVLPNPVKILPRTSCSVDEFTKWMLSARAAALAAGGAVNAKYAAISDALLPYVTAQRTVDLTSETLKNICEQLVTDGLKTQTEVDALGSVPAPPIIRVSRAAALLGTGAFVEAGDIAAALAS